MAGIDTGGHGGSRATDHQIPLIPFIDFLLCLVMFLLVTAVWNHTARVQADANVPGQNIGLAPKKEAKELHVSMRGERVFSLKWKRGSVVLSSLEVERKPVLVGGDVTYPELAKAVKKEWLNSGVYRSATDAPLDRAVLHTDNSTSFGEVLAALDALSAPTRPLDAGGGQTVSVPAFQVTFAAK